MIDDLDLIEEDDQITHTILLEDPLMPENELSKRWLLVSTFKIMPSLLLPIIRILNSIVQIRFVILYKLIHFVFQTYLNMILNLKNMRQNTKKFDVMQLVWQRRIQMKRKKVKRHQMKRQQKLSKVSKIIFVLA